MASPEVTYEVFDDLGYCIEDSTVIDKLILLCNVYEMNVIKLSKEYLTYALEKKYDNSTLEILQKFEEEVLKNLSDSQKPRESDINSSKKSLPNMSNSEIHKEFDFEDEDIELADLSSSESEFETNLKKQLNQPNTSSESEYSTEEDEKSEAKSKRPKLVKKPFFPQSNTRWDKTSVTVMMTFEMNLFASEFTSKLVLSPFYYKYCHYYTANLYCPITISFLRWLVGMNEKSCTLLVNRKIGKN